MPNYKCGNMKPSKKSKIIILLGAPGSGKGTQAELLSDRLNLYCLETSKIIEANVMNAEKGDYKMVNGKRYPLDKERELWLGGLLNTPEVVSFWVKNKIKKLFKKGKGIAFAGSPRTLHEGERLIPLLKKLYGKENIKVILIEQSEKATIWRNTRRRICELMRHPILSTKKEFLKLRYCPLDGSKLLKRKGLDDPEIIKVRLKEYRERTFPLVDYFKKEGLKVKEVNGEQSVERVFKDILKIL